MAQDLVFDYKKLRVRIFEKLGSNQALAEMIGTNKSNLSYKLNGKGYFTPEQIVKICNILESPLEEIGLYFFKEKTDA